MRGMQPHLERIKKNARSSQRSLPPLPGAGHSHDEAGDTAWLSGLLTEQTKIIQDL